MLWLLRKPYNTQTFGLFIKYNHVEGTQYTQTHLHAHMMWLKGNKYIYKDIVSLTFKEELNAYSLEIQIDKAFSTVGFLFFFIRWVHY